MHQTINADFDIDVDVSTLLGHGLSMPFVNARWYELAMPRPGRPTCLQRKLERTLNKELQLAQACGIEATFHGVRRVPRAPILTRIHVQRGRPLTACNISAGGLRCAGEPPSGLLDIEFKVPGGAFPINAQAEVVHLTRSGLGPMAGMRFVSIERPYIEIIRAYVASRLQQQHNAH